MKLNDTIPYLGNFRQSQHISIPFLVVDCTLNGMYCRIMCIFWALPSCGKSMYLHGKKHKIYFRCSALASQLRLLWKKVHKALMCIIVGPILTQINWICYRGLMKKLHDSMKSLWSLLRRMMFLVVKHLCGGELSILMIVPNLVLKVYHQVSFLQSLLPTSWTRHYPITVENPNEGPDCMWSGWCKLVLVGGMCILAIVMYEKVLL